MNEKQAAYGPTYGISEGGPFRALERLLGIARSDDRDWIRRIAVLVALTYGPIVLFGIGWRFIEGRWPETLLLVTTHARALVSLPLLILAEKVVDARAHMASRYVLEAGLVRKAQTIEAYRAVIAQTARLRDSWVIELLLFASAVVSTAVAHLDPSPQAWITFPSLVAFRFLVTRWMWRWLVWALFLFRVSRLPLALRATHPDRLAGLGPLLGPSFGFSAVTTACSAAISAVWADEILYDGAHVFQFYPMAIVLVMIAGTIALLPLCAFIPALYQARWGGLEHYGALAQRFTYEFEERWYGGSGKAAVDSENFSSLADMGTSFSVVSEIRLFPWTTRFVKQFALWGLLPVVPLVVFDLGIHEVISRLGSTLF